MSARAFGSLLGGYGIRKSKGNSAAPTDPVRAHSYDVEDPRANPHRAIGDGSAGHGWAFTGALIATLHDLRRQQREADYRGPFRIQYSYLEIARHAFKILDFTTGRWIFSTASLAKAAGCGERTVKAFVLAMEAHGFFQHVRRSQRIEQGEDKQPGWQRRQVANAFFFDCKARMSPDLWAIFWRHLMSRLKRLAGIAARAASAVLRSFNSVARAAPREASTELKLLLHRVGAGVDRRVAALSRSKKTHSQSPPMSPSEGSK